jgi:hypothetical protein
MARQNNNGTLNEEYILKHGLLSKQELEEMKNPRLRPTHRPNPPPLADKHKKTEAEKTPVKDAVAEAGRRLLGGVNVIGDLLGLRKRGKGRHRHSTPDWMCKLYKHRR